MRLANVNAPSGARRVIARVAGLSAPTGDSSSVEPPGRGAMRPDTRAPSRSAIVADAVWFAGTLTVVRPHGAETSVGPGLTKITCGPAGTSANENLPSPATGAVSGASRASFGSAPS